ncbi:MAG: aldo/keto reductase [Armatimonadota bacterium]
MEQVAFADLCLSRLMLGTVQFGLNYGVANRNGMPSFAEVCEILAYAHDHGVNCLDTAAGYGTSEEVLGRALQELSLADHMLVVSKVRALGDMPLSSQEADRLVEESVVNSLRRLQLEVLPLCLFHREEDYQYIDSLLKLKERGLIAHAGISVYSPEITGEILAEGLVKAVQIPASILDQRFRRAGLLEKASAHNVAVFVRSVYLQGLLLMPNKDLLPEFDNVVVIRRSILELIGAADMELAELAVRYILGVNGVTSVLTGVESLAQMKRNIEIAAKGALDPTLTQAINTLVPELPKTVLIPFKWPKRFIRAG